MGYKMKGSPAKLGTIQGTSGHASALKHSKGGKPHKHLFQKVHPKGKKFWDTKLGESISDIKEKFVKKKTDKEIIKQKSKGVKDPDVKVPGTGGLGKKKKPLMVHKSSSGSGVTKPASRVSTSYHSKGGKGYTFVRGGGDPYQYRSTDEGKTFQYKKIGEQGWNDVKGGFTKISKSYQESKSPTKGK